ncbi:uncharacterized protein ColSpa_09346 [Colletotrichum spaethianum]|uniref:Uncharacterized protein n=1 Tax=Colletotrichum spaethianum TaxID=700344 RepID=A0AA37PBK3_9PEZI|nr:uncharacterized protein ColSpa_09346 [Colletotrichum spaethianum]GKT49165.1 hypothetical protein ColSpa_09346 [Colletotrichum spaethianum]
MTFKLVTVLVTLVIQALASPAEPPQPHNPENWSVMAFRRVCPKDQGQCSYSFLISEDPTKAPKYCNFAVDATGGLPAYQTDFSVLKCPDAPEYTINGGWDERQFITLTVINEQRNLLSFFAFKDADLWAGTEATPQTSKAFIYPMPAKREVKQKEQGEAEDQRKRLEEAKKKKQEKEREEGKKLEEARKKDWGIAYASEWKLVDVTKYEFNSGPYTDRLVMVFGIQSGNSTIEACHINIPLFEGLRALGKSFAHQECKHGGWSASWGQNETTGMAVMTLIK